MRKNWCPSTATNRLRTWTNGTTTASYTYEPFGRRIGKTVGSVTTWYLWDGDRLLAEYDASGDRTARYAYAGGWAPIQYATPDGGSGENIYDVHADHLDTPKLLTDATGSPVWRAVHEAFGRAALDPASTVTFNVRFPGQYFDGETGLHYNRYRFYDAGIGRYISADPLGQEDGPDVYLYVSNDPIGSADPLGLFEDSVTAKCRSGSPSACAALGVGLGALGTGAAAATQTGRTILDDAQSTPQPADAAKPITCTVKCHIVENGPGNPVLDVAVQTHRGPGTGPEICALAKRSILVPPGCRTRHCRCDCDNGYRDYER